MKTKRKISVITALLLILSGCTERSMEDAEIQSMAESMAESMVGSILESETESTKEKPRKTSGSVAQYVMQPMEIKTYDPFPNWRFTYSDEIAEKSGEKNDTFASGVSDFLQRLAAAQLLINADSEIYDSGEFTDTDTILQGDEASEFVYKPFINTQIARTEDELYEYVRRVYTVEYYSDDQLRDALFGDPGNGYPKYKTIDGRLCILCGGNADTKKIETDKFVIISVGENDGWVTLAANAHDSGYPPYHAHIEAPKNGEDWRVHSLRFDRFDQAACDVVFNGLNCRDRQLDTYLKGDEKYAEPKTITIDGESYTQVKIAEPERMRQFFEKTFAEEIELKDENGNVTGVKYLRQDYIDKYIDDVYIVQAGDIYRRDSALRWYVPGFSINKDKTVGSGSRLGNFDAVLNYYGDRWGESFDVSFYSRGIEFNGEEKIYDIYITSELPIEEIGRADKLKKLDEEIYRPVIEKKLRQLEMSEDMQDISVYSGTLIEINGDGNYDYLAAYDLGGCYQLVAIDSQSGEILIDERIMTSLKRSDKLEYFANDNGGYAFRVTKKGKLEENSPRPGNIYINQNGESVYYDVEYGKWTGALHRVYDSDGNEFTREEYIQLQQEFLDGYTHYTDVEWYDYTSRADGNKN